MSCCVPANAAEFEEITSLHGKPPVTEAAPAPASKDDELAAKRQITPLQENANAKAAAHIAKVAADMEKVPEDDREPAKDSYGGVMAPSCWDTFGGAVMERALEHTPLIDLEYLVTLGRLGGVMPCGLQRVPPGALITKSNLWRLKQWNKRRNKYALGILVFSYPWLDWFHPDRLGAQLRRLLPFLEAMLQEAKYDSPYCTIGVTIDFLCLPQKPFASPDEEARFKRSLSCINEWYFHKSTYVLLVTTPPPAGAEYSNVRLHKDRGWCDFEKNASMVVKNGWCLLDFGAYKGAKEFCDFRSANDRTPGTCIGDMAPGRIAPLSPAVFGEDMRARVESGALQFTAKADLELVIGQYEKGLVETLNFVAAEKDVFRCLVWQNMNWGDAEAAQILEALRFVAHRCVFPHGPVKVALKEGNHISKDMISRLDGKFSGHEFTGKFFVED